MKKLLPIVLLLIFAATSHAGTVGWITSHTRSWEFIRQTGGIRISAPIKKDGRTVLPVEYDVTGRRTITQKPTLLNSGFAVRKIELKKKNEQIIICVVTQLGDKDADVGPVHYADLEGFPPGKYEVFYETSRDTGKYLGRIEIR